jgi:hypothetical protein
MLPAVPSRLTIRFTAAAVALSALLVGISITASAASATSPSSSVSQTEDDSAMLTTAQTASDGSLLAAPDEVAATAEARASGSMVNVVGDTTEESATWANPDGSFTSDETGTPTRVPDSSEASGWRDVDDTLVVNADGSVSPRSPYEPIVLSGEATATQVANSGVVNVQDGNGSSVKFGWSGGLPQPQLLGDTATYLGVDPNLNIVVTLTATGFEQDFVLTGPPTASELNLVLPLSAPGLTAKAQQGGSIDFNDSSSALEGTIAPAFMWDSRVDPNSGLPIDEVPLTLSATSSSLDVTSPSSFFDDPNVVYPVTIDPSYTLYPADTYVRSDFPTTKYESFDPDELEVGTYNGGASVARAFLNFSTNPWTQTLITGATLNVYEFHAYNCTASTMYAQYSGVSSATTDWDDQPGRSATDQGSVTVSKGGDGCAEGAGSYGIDVQSLITDDSTYTGGSIGIALVAASETADDGWKRLYSDDDATASFRPYLEVTYLHPASTPPAPTFSSPTRACGTSGSPTFINGTQTTDLTSAVSDSDGVPLTDTAKIFATSSSAGNFYPVGSSIYTTAPSAAATSGSVNMAIPGNTLSAGTYAADTQTQYVGNSAANSAWSGYCFFTVKDIGPSLPSIIIVGTAPTRVGQSVTVKFTGSDAGYSGGSLNTAGVFAYWWEPDGSATSPTLPVTVGVNPASFPATGNGSGEVRYADVASDSGGTLTSATVSVAPTNTTSTLWVALFDAEGNPSTNGATPPSPAVGHAFGTPTVLASDTGFDYSHGHEWFTSLLTPPIVGAVTDANTTTPVTPPATTVNESDLTLGASTLSSTDDNNNTAFQFPNPSGTTATDVARSAREVVDTTQAFSVAAWVEPTSTTTGNTEIAVSQAAVSPGSAAFRLGMSSDGHYEFCMRPQSPAGSAVCARGAAATSGSPELIVGIWDPANQQIRLLAGPFIEPSMIVSYSPPSGDTSSTGSLLIGSDYTSGAATSEWQGWVENPAIFPGIIDAHELMNLIGDHAITF